MVPDLGNGQNDQQFVDQEFVDEMFADAFEAFVREQALFVEKVHQSLLELSQVESPKRTEPRKTASKPALNPMVRTSVLVVESSELYRVLFGRVFGSEPLDLVFAKTEDEAEQLQSEKTFQKVIRGWGQRIRGLPSQTDRQTLIEEVRLELGLAAEL